MVEIDELASELDFVSIKVSADVLNKCLEVCVAHNLDAEGFVEEWVALAESSLGGNFNLTLRGLDILVRKLLADHGNSIASKPVADPKNDLNNSFNTCSPVQQTKDVTTSSLDEECSNSSFAVSDSSTTYLHNIKLLGNYAKRSDAGTVLTTFDPKQLLQTKFTSVCGKPVKVQLLDTGDIKNMPVDCKYMLEVIEDEIAAFISKMTRITNILINKYSLDVRTTGPDSDLHIALCGRIRSEDDGRLNESSVLLETFGHTTNGRIGVIQPKNLKEYSLFPGQIIAMRTHINPCKTRDILTPQIIHIDATPDLPEELPDIGDGPLKIMAACGPFTLLDNLTYQPLQDLVKVAAIEQPDVLLLVGPFVDARHTCVASGEITDTFHSYFETLMSDILSPLHDTKIQIILIPSTFDVHHHNIYPTPPFNFQIANVHMIPDPSLFSVNGVVIGVTSVDVLLHMGKSEFNYPANSPDRIGRFISHLLEQQSFYPLYPPVKKLRVDQVLLEKYAKIPVMPHLMILPSNLGQFVKNVNGCIVINPERLSKGYVGGTFAQIEIYPNQTNPSLANNISCKIIKI